MSVNSTKEQLRNAFRQHEKLAGKGNTMSHKLVLFYAVECGLKSYYLKSNNIADTVGGNLQQRYGHKIDKLARDCKIPNICPIKDSNFPIKNFHEHMRYGCALPPNIEIGQQQYLQKLTELITKLI